MNRENIQWTIDLLKAVPPENFDINVWFNGNLYYQHYEIHLNHDNTDFAFSETVAPEGGQPLHTCGNTACVWGWMSLEPHFRNWVKANPHKFETDVEIDETDQAAAFWGVDVTFAAFIIAGDYDNEMEDDIGTVVREYVELPEYWSNFKPGDVVRILQAALDGNFEVEDV